MKQINWEEEHMHYHAVVDHLTSKNILSEVDEITLRQAKKMRLRAKDRLTSLGRY